MQDDSAEEVNTEKVNTEKVNTEKVNTEKVNAEKVNTEKVNAEKVNAEKVNAEENIEKANDEKTYIEKTYMDEEHAAKIKQTGKKRHTGLYGAGLFWIGLLIIWFKLLQTATQLCMYGGVRRHLPILMLCGAIILVWFLLWTFVYLLILKPQLGKKITGKWKKAFKLIFAAELMVFILITAFYGRQIAGSAMHYSGKLAWEIDSLLNWKNVSLKHNNVYRDGAEGIFGDLDRKLNLPDEIYIINRFMIQYDQDGKITGIDGFFCGKKENGQERTWLLTYNGKGSMKVRESAASAADATYLTKERRIRPMLEIIGAADLQKDTLNMAQKNQSDSFELLYYGYRDTGADGIVPVLGKSAGFSEGYYQGRTLGYEVSLSEPGKEDTIVPVRYLDTRP